MDNADSRRPTQRRRLIVNPVSGSADHASKARLLAASNGFSVVETERKGHATDLATQAVVDGVDLLAVCGGDGTVHEVVEGLVASGALDAMTLCVIPAGTANIIAGELGIETLADGFEVADHGETRQIDLGILNDEPFVMSALAGLPADVSDATTAALKERFGSFAFVIGGIKEGLSFDGIQVRIAAEEAGDDTAWAGQALAVLVGNLRRLGTSGGHANAEDGLLDIEIIEDLSPGSAVVEAIEQRLLGQPSPHVRTLRSTHIEVTSLGEVPIRFSLDGEIRTFETVTFGIRPHALRIRVGPEYTPRS